LSTSTGDILGEQNLGKGVISSAALLVDSNTVYASCLGKLSAFNIDDLTEKWVQPLKGWRFSEVHSLAFSSAGNILLSMNGWCGAFNCKGGEELWKSERFRKLNTWSSVVVLHDKVIIQSSGKLVVLDTNNGKLLFVDDLKKLGYSTGVLACHNRHSDSNNSTLMQAIQQARESSN